MTLGGILKLKLIKKVLWTAYIQNNKKNKNKIQIYSHVKGIPVLHHSMGGNRWDCFSAGKREEKFMALSLHGSFGGSRRDLFSGGKRAK